MNGHEFLLKELSEGRLTRREFVKRATAIGLAAAIPAGLVSPLSHAAAAPKRGGHLRMAFHGGSTTDSMDTQALTSEFSNMLFYIVLGHLTEVAPDGQLVPQIAESYEANATADEWTFNLRKGVEFHNGKTLDADDVIMSVDNHRGEESKSQVKAFVDQIVESRKNSPTQVTFKLKEGNADFPFLFSSGALGILPVKDGKLEFGVGCGSYFIERFDAGVSCDLKRFENHFRDDVGFFDSANIGVVSDSNARQTALVTGQADYIDDVPPNTAKLLGRKDGVKVLAVTGTTHYTFPMRVDTPPYDNNDLRLAMKYAFNREDALERVLDGYGSLGNDHPISPANRYFDKDLPQRDYDPDKARFHFKKSGVSATDFELSGSEGLYPGCMDMILLYKEHAAEAGIGITPKRMPSDGYWSDVWLKHPWSASTWSGRPTEDWMFSQGYSATSNWNETYWKHDRFNELLVAARAELDDNKRRAMYYEMQALVRDDGGSVIPVFSNHISAHSEKLGVPAVVAGNWPTDGYKMIERWWFA